MRTLNQLQERFKNLSAALKTNNKIKRSQAAHEVDALLTDPDLINLETTTIQTHPQSNNPTRSTEAHPDLESLLYWTQVDQQDLFLPLEAPKKASLSQELSLSKSAGADEYAIRDQQARNDKNSGGKDDGKDDDKDDDSIFGSMWLNALGLGGLLAGGLLIYKAAQKDDEQSTTGANVSTPTVAVGDDNGNGRPEVTGTAQPSSTVSIVWPDGSSSTVATNASGRYAIEAPTVQLDGTITASSKDQAGNTSGKVTEYYQDQTAPAKPTTAITDEDGDGKPEVAGTTEAGSTVTIKWPNGSSNTVLANSNGQYKIESLTTQPEGTVTTTAKDAHGNISDPAEQTYTKTQITTPTVTVIDPGTGKPIITGVTDPFSTVMIVLPNKTTMTTTSDSNGEYKITSPTVQPEGSVTATTTNIKGNTSTPTDEKYTDKVSPSKPSITISDPDLDQKPDVTGTAEPLSKVTLTWPDGSSSTTQTNSLGIYKIESPLTQLAGSITATVTDLNNNSSAPVAGVFNPSQTGPTPPTVTVIDPGTGKPIITGVTDPFSTVMIVLPNKTTMTTTSDSNGEYKITSPTVQPEGSVTATTTNIKGNTSTPTDEKYTDKVSPSKPSITISDPDLDQKPDVTGTAEPLSKVTLTWPDGSSTTTQTNSLGIYKIESPLTQLAGSVTATVTDLNNNSSAPVTGTFNPTITNPTAPTPPTVAVIDPGTGKPIITGVTDPFSTVTIVLPNKTTMTTTSDSNGEYKITSPTVQPEGSVTATTTNIKGNTSTPTDEKYTDKVSPSKPSITISDPDLDQKPDVTGTAEPLSKVTLTWPDGSSTTTQTNSLGIYKIESPLTQLAGSVTATVTDLNNNSSAPVTGVYKPSTTEPVDPTAPTAPTVTVIDPGTGKPIITGVTDPFSTVTIVLPNKTTMTTTSDSNGEYKITSPTVQPEGSVTATTTNIKGNTSTPTGEKYTDKVNPSKPSITISDPDLDQKPDVTGTAEPLSKVTLTWPDGSSTTTQTNSLGIYKIESPLTQLAGSITATVTDLNNNSSAPVTGTFNPTITNPTAPTPPTVAVIDPGTGKPIITGVTDPFSTVTIVLPNKTTMTTTSDSNGEYKITSPTVQPEGSVTATTTNIKGNTSTPTDEKYTDKVSPSKPSITISDPDLDQKPDVTGTAEPLSKVTLTWPDGSSTTTQTNSLGIYKIESPLTQLAGSVTATVTDVNNNSSAPVTGVFNPSQTGPTPPTVTVIDPGTGKPIITGVTDPFSTVIIILPNKTTMTTTSNSTGEYKITSPTVQPEGSVTATTTNIKGNTSTPTDEKYTDSVEPRAPSLSVDDPDGNGRPDAVGTAEPLSKVFITWPDGSISSVLSDSKGNYQAQSPTAQPLGTVTASCMDVNGNTSADVTDQYIDVLAPTAPTAKTSDPDLDNRPTVTGTAEPFATLLVTWPDQSTALTVADSTGVYSIESRTMQTTGTVTVQAKDASGNTSPKVDTPYTDITIPKTPTVSASDPDNDNRPTAVGSAEAGSKVTITWPDGSTDTVIASSSGSYAIEATKPQLSGSITVSTIDAAGNTSGKSEALYTDKTAPVVVIVTVKDGDNDGLPEVIGTSEPFSTVTIVWPDGSTSSSAANSTGDFVVESLKVQPSGTVVATAIDAEENLSAPVNAKYLDQQNPNPPTLTVTDPGTGIPQVTGTAEPMSKVTLTWPTGATSTTMTDSKGVYKTTAPTVQPEGTVTATTTDINGNSSVPAEEPYVDLQPPEPPTLTVTDPGTGIPQVTGTAEPMSKVTLTWPTGVTSTVLTDSNGVYKTTAPTVQPEGTVTATTTDINGNSSVPAEDQYKDKQIPNPPTINVTDPNNDGKPDVTGTAEPLSTVTLIWPTGVSTTVQTDSKGIYKAIAPTVQPNGTVTATTTDLNGNSSTPAKEPYVDKQPPEPPTLTVTDPGTGLPQVTGTAEPLSTVTLTWPTGVTSTATTDSNGIYKTTAPTVQPEGTVTATTTDINGNSSVPAADKYADNTKPQTPTITTTDEDGDGKPEAKGTAEPFSTVRLTWPNGETSTALTNSMGNYQVESQTVQPEGSVTGTATDLNGNSSSEIVAKYTDTYAPATPTITATDPDADNMPTATGTAEPNSKVIVTWPDGSSISTTVTTTGTYSVESLTTQTSGTVKAVSIDAAGNSSPVATGTYTDATASTAPTITATDPDADNMPTATGTAEPNSKVIVTWPDGSSISTTATATGTYTVESLTKQTSGSVKAVSIDAAGNSSPVATGTYTDATASTAPTITATDPDADNMPTATGTAEPNSKVIVTWPDGSSISTTATATGTYTVESLTKQTSGTVKAVSIDAAGNSSPVATSTYTDATASTAPTITATDPDADNMPTATGTAEPNSKVIVTWPDGSSISTTATATGTYTVESLTKQTSGTVKAVSIDAAGNSSPVATGTYTDATASTAPTITATDPDADNMPTATGTAEPNSKVIVTWPDGSSISTTATAAGTYTVESLTTQTSGTVKAVSVDAAGNSSPVATGTYTDTTASTAPTITATDPDADNMPTATGTAEPNSKVIVTWPDGSSISTTATATGTYTVESLTKQTSGSVKAVSVDAAGNSSPVATGTYTDATASTAPTITATDPDADNMPTATGTAEPNSKVIVTWPDGSSISTTATATGTYTVESLTTQTSGTVKAVSIDAAGNSSPVATGTYTDTTASTAPTITATDPDVDNMPTATGTAEPNSKVIVTWPDGSSISTTATATGTYTVESLTTQTSGTVKAVSIDAAGNSSPVATGTYTDTTASTAPTITATDPDADNMPTATGTAEPNSKVIVTWPDGSSISTTATAAGTYTVESLTKQTSGSVKAVSVDAAGNSSPVATGTYTDTTASTAPTIAATDPDADNMPTATGTAEPNSKVIVTWPDGSSISTTATATGTYAVESLTKQTSGSVKAVSVDTAGNSSPVVNGTYTDTTAPTAPTITASDSDLDNMPTATGTAEPNSKVIVTWPDGSSISTTATATGTYTVESLTTQIGGAVKAYAVDPVGNAGLTAQTTFVPEVQNVAPVNQTVANLAGVSAANVSVQGLSISDSDAGSGTVTVTLSVANGTLSLAGGTASVTGSGSAQLVLTGTVSQINDSLSTGGLAYKSNAGFVGTDNITMKTNDNANSGAGGAKEDQDIMPIVIASPISILVNAATANGAITESFTATTQNPYKEAQGALNTALFRFSTLTSTNWFATGVTGGLLPTGGSGQYFLINSKGAVTTQEEIIISPLSNTPFTSMTFTYRNVTQTMLTVYAMDASNNIVSSVDFLPASGTGTKTFTVSCSSPATRVQLSDVDNQFSIDNLSITPVGNQTISTGGATTDATPAISGTISRTLVAGESIEVYRDGVKIGVGTVSAKTWSYADSTAAGLHAYSAKVVSSSSVIASTTSDFSLNVLGTPIALDLNGDGLHTISMDVGVTFDLNADGTDQRVGWIDHNDGFLVLDRSGNGKIDNGSEMFGSSTPTPDGAIFETGWDALRSYDANRDDVIDQNDQIWAELQIWQDDNTNGITDEGELLSLNERGIVSISLAADQREVSENGNLIKGYSTYATADGQAHEIADAYVQVDPSSSLGAKNDVLVECDLQLQTQAQLI